MGIASELVGAGIGLAVGVSGAMAKSWVALRAKTAEELRAERLEATRYPAVWKLTSALSVWPRQEPTYGELAELHRSLRQWYYDGGGIYLSERSRARYGDVQELIAAHVAVGGDPRAPLAPRVYDGLMKTCSALRTALAEDLETRRQRSFWWTLARIRWHRQKAKEAEQRIAAARRRTGPEPESAAGTASTAPL
jgi:hypothetical protein